MDKPVNRPRDGAARAAGWLLLATAAATVVAVIGRVSAQADLATLAESLAAIGSHRGRYAIGGAARLISGLTLLVGRGSCCAPGSCACAWARGWCRCCSASPAWPPRFPAPAPWFWRCWPRDHLKRSRRWSGIRWISGKIGFSLAGLGLIAAALRQWRVGGFLRPVAPVSALIGVAMQLIWVDAAIMAHRVTGPAFVVWLMAIGVMLVTGRVEQRFADLAQGQSSA